MSLPELLRDKGYCTQQARSLIPPNPGPMSPDDIRDVQIATLLEMVRQLEERLGLEPTFPRPSSPE